MVLFCPTCHNMLLVRRGGVQFHCAACPYVFDVKEKVTRKTILKPKKVDDAVGKEHEDRGSKIPAVCPHCNHNEAWVFQLQIRSGDEPMTCFFTCCSCEKKWREQ